MSGVIIAGNTSGSVTLDAPDVAGTTVITLPTTSGTMALSGGAGSFTTLAASGISTLTGNVGIGITPTLPLHVKGATSTGLNETLRISAGNTGVSGPSVGFHNYYNDNSYPTWKLGEIGALYAGGAEYQGALVFHTNTGTTATSLTEKMRLTNTGQLTVGSTSPVSAGWLTLNYDGQNYNGLMTRTTTSGTYYGAMFKNVSDAFVGNISISASATAYNTSSDYRLKDNVAPMTGALARVALLKPVTYSWKIDGSAGEGFIAHELQEVCPLAVTGEKDAVFEDGSVKSQSIDVSFLVATLTAAIQEQQALIENLTTRLSALENK